MSVDGYEAKIEAELDKPVELRNEAKLKYWKQAMFEAKIEAKIESELRKPENLKN